MNEAACNVVRCDPLISLTALRFFKLAGVNRDQFLAGFRQRIDGAQIDLQVRTAKAPKVARLIAACGYDYVGGLRQDLASNVLQLSFATSDFRFTECVWPSPEIEGTNHAILTLYRQQIPETVLLALIGRPLTDLVGGRKQFFLSRHTRIRAASTFVEDGDPALELFLGDKWMPFSRFLKLL
ncbi:hypothetical protein EJC47_00735 [Sphingomonas sp. TF3]|uniref:hypothetical protein n=1 Tax=Sphingomonas sp. TF3 TaxID=2495580 RepID=UPI000F880F8C|nr:hypothetical protein [Sphingomonas sp. TF3]RUN78435.1 hypothetical protein EJC47_00735 [Sphingomonas sp. TF3]